MGSITWTSFLRSSVDQGAGEYDPAGEGKEPLVEARK